jgi:Rod binding domain-containing protein
MARIRKAAQDFEASYLSNALSSMFAGIETSEPFGGGEGEAAFKSFLTEAYAKQISRAGGVGLADAVQKEILKMQGLDPEPNP